MRVWRLLRVEDCTRARPSREAAGQQVKKKLLWGQVWRQLVRCSQLVRCVSPPRAEPTPRNKAFSSTSTTTFGSMGSLPHSRATYAQVRGIRCSFKRRLAIEGASRHPAVRSGRGLPCLTPGVASTARWRDQKLGVLRKVQSGSSAAPFGGGGSCGVGSKSIPSVGSLVVSFSAPMVGWYYRVAVIETTGGQRRMGGAVNVL